MKIQKITPIVFPSGKQRMFRYTIAALNAATLAVTIAFVTWIVGRMIGALHALVFSLVLPTTPDLSPTHFPILEEFNARGEVYSILEDSGKSFDRTTVYTVDHRGWDQ